MTTTYCSRSDIESILSPAGVLACIDDDENGVESAAESLHVTNAIQRAAVRLNLKIGKQYKLADVTANAWMKWANAILATAILTQRRNNALGDSLAAEVKEIEDLAEQIAWGRRNLPEQTPSFDSAPTVSNLRPELYKYQNPVRVVVPESTGPIPDSTRHRNVSGDYLPY